MKGTTPASLLKAAVQAARHAYCPYSHYRVGAALLTADGKVFRGCNVENASYGLTVCAERAAVFAAVAAGYRKFKALAVVAAPEESVQCSVFSVQEAGARTSSGRRPVLPPSTLHRPPSTALPYPCGACRQVLAEFCGPGFRIYVAPLDDPAGGETFTLGRLLPKAFQAR